MTTIGIVDNDRLSGSFLASLLHQSSSLYNILWAVTSGTQALHRCINQQQSPNLLITDIVMDDMSGIDLCHSIREAQLSTAVICMTAYPLERYSNLVQESGAQAIVSKQNIKQLLCIVHDVIEQGSYGTCVNADKANHNYHAYRLQQTTSLSKRELEILKLYAQGYSTPQIADICHITRGTVATYEHRAMTKLGASSRLQAVLIAERNKLW